MSKRLTIEQATQRIIDSINLLDDPESASIDKYMNRYASLRELSEEARESVYQDISFALFGGHEPEEEIVSTVKVNEDSTTTTKANEVVGSTAGEVNFILLSSQEARRGMSSIEVAQVLGCYLWACLRWLLMIVMPLVERLGYLDIELFDLVIRGGMVARRIWFLSTVIYGPEIMTKVKRIAKSATLMAHDAVVSVVGFAKVNAVFALTLANTIWRGFLVLWAEREQMNREWRQMT